MSGGEFVGPAVKVGVASARPAAGWFRRRVRPDTSRLSSEGSVADLADAVARSERKLLDQLAAGAGTVIDLEVSITARQQLTGEDGAAAVELSDLGEAVGRMASPARIVLLGAPGAGKTVAAIHLLLALLDQRVQLPEAVQARTPVPVRINAAGWDGTDLSAWLTYRLSIDYSQHPRAMRKLVDDGRILPVLDGLDEMDPSAEFGDEHSAMPYARAALDAVNRSPWRNRPVVVTCRTADFERLREIRGDGGIHGATTLTLRALPPEAIIDYLTDYRTQLGAPPATWDAIIDRINEHPNGSLAAALSTPWLLRLTASAVHHSPTIAPCLVESQSTTEIRDRLLATLIPAAVGNIDSTDTSTADYTADNVERWLTTLATHLTHTRAAGLSLNNLSTITGRTWAAITAVAIGLMSGLAVGIVVGIGVGIAEGLMFGLVFGLTVGIVVGRAGWSENITTQRMSWRVPGRSRWPRALVVGLVVGLVFGLVGGLMFGLVFGLAVGLVFGLTVGLMFGLTVGLAVGLETTDSDRLRLGQDETRVIRDDLVFGLVFGFVGWPVGGLVFGLTGGLVVGPALGLVVGLVFGLAFGLVVGLAIAGASVNYVLACLFFWRSGVLPRRPRVFLHWARRAGLLRVSGIEYQFRHDTFQQWLAAGSPDAKAGAPCSSPPGDEGESRR